MPVAFEPTSTWRQPLPDRVSPARRRLVEELAAGIDGLSPRRLRVAVDGFTGAGGTTFGHELAAALRARGRSAARASLDDFKHPWRHAREHGYDRVSGRGYYENAYDTGSMREDLLEPAGRDGGGDRRPVRARPAHGDGPPLDPCRAPGGHRARRRLRLRLRPEIDDCWEHRVWLEVDPEVALRRGIARDADREGRAEAEALHRDRYRVAEAVYLGSVDARVRADVVVDNTDLDHPVLLAWR